MDKLSNGLIRRLSLPFHNSSGATLIYILAAFMIISFMGITMIKASHHEITSSTDYSSMMTASQAARSGLMATKQFIEKDPNSTNVLALLNAYIQDPNHNPRWILGDDATKITIDGQMSYRTKLLNFAYDRNEDDFRITVQSTGYGRGNSEKTITSVIDMQNLDWKEDVNTQVVPVNALQADNGAFEFNIEFEVNGNVSFFKGLTMNNGPFVFNGTFRVDPERSTGAMTGIVGNASGTYTGKTYIGIPYETNGGIQRFDDLAGFNKQYKFSNDPVFNGDTVYFNGGANLNGWGAVDLNGKALVAYNGASFKWGSTSRSANNFFSNYEDHITSIQIADLAQRMNLTSPPPPIYFDYQTPLTHPDKLTISSNTTVTVAWLNTKYNEQLAAGKLWKNKFLIVHYPSSYTTYSGWALKSNGVDFHGKAIIIMESPNWQNSQINTTSSANVALYVHHYNKYTNAFIDNDYFRGFIYIKNVTSDYIPFYNNSVSHSRYIGAVYASPQGKLKFDGGASTKTTISFDQGVIEELATTNIFTDPTTIVTPTNELELKDPLSNIPATELALQY